MKPIITFVFTLFLVGNVTKAGEGFSVSVGLGGLIPQLSSGSLADSLSEIGRADGRLLTDTLSFGLGVKLSLAYNIKGWVSIEGSAVGHGWNLSGEDIGGSGYVSAVVHFHPGQIWWPDRPWDATVFLGGGWSIVGGGHAEDSANRGLYGGTIDCGFSGHYFFTPWFSAGLEFRFFVPFYKTWIVDWSDERHALKSSPSAFFLAILPVATFHFVPQNSIPK